jgi:hypothetical protein
MIHIDLVPHDVKKIAGDVGKFTKRVREALESKTALEIEAVLDELLPQYANLIEEDRRALIRICNTAIATCQTIQDADWSGVEARLQRVGSDITRLLHGELHGISAYIQWFEVVFNHLFGKQANA